MTGEDVLGWLGAAPELELGWDEATSSLLVGFAPQPMTCFTRRLVGSVLGVVAGVRSLNESAPRHGRRPVSFVVFHSTMPGCFSSGGDLRVIAAAAAARDDAVLSEYGREAVDACHAMTDGLGAGVVTISAVSGVALGSGFEVARCCDLLVATPSSRFRMPEVGFGLHPGHGAMSVLSRHVPAATLRAMVLDGEWLDAADARDAGVVDALAPDEDALGAALALAADLAPRHAAALAYHRGRTAAWGVTREMMRAEAARWAEAAARVEEPGLSRMARTVALQARRQGAAGRRDAGGGEA